jgi:tripartite-type tricarboxylate transporter receptor subunit TctC
MLNKLLRAPFFGAIRFALPAALLAFALPVAGQAYPNKPVKLVVAFTAGGTTDNLTRLIGQRLGDRYKQSFIVENKPGGGGNIGTEFVVRSPADGYTLIVNSVGPMAINSTLYKNLSYDPLVDLVPIVQFADVPNVLVVPPSLNIKTMAELLAYAKANPTGTNYASTGTGTSSHLAGYLLAQKAGFTAQHVPYKGAGAVVDLLAGRVQFMFATIPSVIGHIRAGKLNAIAVSSLQRSKSMPNVPTVHESGFPEFQAGSWFGLFAPKGTPAAITAELNKAVNEILKDPAIAAKMETEGADPVGGTAAQYGAFIKAEHEKWKAVVKASGAVAE